MGQRFVGKDSQWLGIPRIGIGTMKSELGFLSGGGNSSGSHCSYRDPYRGSHWPRLNVT